MDCLGQRYIGCGSSEGHAVLRGTPGNALGAYMDGARITLYGNAQDATGDTMNSGCICIHGNTGDAAGYAMRGGEIYIKGDAGYRAGIHMKEYREMIPVIVIGGKCGSFLGEYQAGGIIIVLGLGSSDSPPVGRFCGTGMHGGRIYIRSATLPWDLPEQVAASAASPADMEYISSYLKKFCEMFGEDYETVSGGAFQVLKPNTKSPYKQLYVFY